MTDLDASPDRPDEPGGEPTAPTGPPAAPPRRRSTVGIWIGLVVLVVVLGVVALALSAPGSDDAVATPSAGTPTQAPPTAAAPGQVSIEGEPRTEPIPDGSMVPDWSAPALAGGTIEWAERATGPTVLAIWAPWCPHCQAELPRLSAAVDAHPTISLVTIATATDAEGPTPQEYLDSVGLAFPVALDDEAGTLAKGLGVAGFPTTYFVDGAGRVVVSASGELDPAAVEELLSYLEAT